MSGRGRIDPRRFILVRDEDVSGVSGCGKVAEGVRFSSGKVVLSWLTQYHSIGVYETIKELLDIHGHCGTTRIEWID